jgi:hypothetical protein
MSGVLRGSLLDLFDIEQMCEDICRRAVRVMVDRASEPGVIIVVGDFSAVEAMKVKEELLERVPVHVVLRVVCGNAALIGAASAAVRLGCPIDALPERYKEPG